ncbi:MAG: polyisoprenyl-phosphate glycosyltransferase [Gaiellaceae bacterium]|nr:polyisoprenyl-phosphate glycosyltransferase [Gaiellaceae bacterium]
MSEFDRYGESYEQAVGDAIGFGRQEHAFYLEAKGRVLVELARREIGDPARIHALDVGSGPGSLHPYLAKIGALEGVDVSQALVERAAAANPAVRYRTYDGETLPFADESFDLAFAVNVFHHVDPPDRAALAAELARVVRPGGIVAVFEHNPLNPLTRLVVSRCEFDAGVELLSTREVSALLTRAGLQPVERRYILFFPWRAAFLQRLEARLGPVPLGAQHLTAARRSD